MLVKTTEPRITRGWRWQVWRADLMSLAIALRTPVHPGCESHAFNGVVECRRRCW